MSVIKTIIIIIIVLSVLIIIVRRTKAEGEFRYDNYCGEINHLHRASLSTDFKHKRPSRRLLLPFLPQQALHHSSYHNQVPLFTQLGLCDTAFTQTSDLKSTPSNACIPGHFRHDLVFCLNTQPPTASCEYQALISSSL